MAALPSLETHDTIEQEKGEEKDMEVKHEEDIDNIKLGEEGEKTSFDNLFSQLTYLFLL